VSIPVAEASKARKRRLSYRGREGRAYSCSKKVDAEVIGGVADTSLQQGLEHIAVVSTPEGKKTLQDEDFYDISIAI
jgi:hypothetical protein